MKSEKNKTTITEVTPTVSFDSPDTSFTHYVMVKVDEKGKEIGDEFNVSKKGFEQTFKNRTAKPDGTADKPQFKVKKKTQLQ